MYFVYTYMYIHMYIGSYTYIPQHTATHRNILQLACRRCTGPSTVTERKEGIYIYVCMYVCLGVFEYIYTDTHMYVYIHSQGIHIYIHIYIFMYLQHHCSRAFHALNH